MRLSTDLDFLKSITLAVLDPTNFIYTRVSSIAQLLYDLKVNQFGQVVPLVLHLVTVAESLLASFFLGWRRDAEPLSDQLGRRLLAVRVRVHIAQIYGSGGGIYRLRSR